MSLKCGKTLNQDCPVFLVVAVDATIAHLLDVQI
jgi:hypothetical protein